MNRLSDRIADLHRQVLALIEEVDETKFPLVHRQLYYATTKLRLAAFNMQHNEREETSREPTE